MLHHFGASVFARYWFVLFLFSPCSAWSARAGEIRQVMWHVVSGGHHVHPVSIMYVSTSFSLLYRYATQLLKQTKKKFFSDVLFKFVSYFFSLSFPFHCLFLFLFPVLSNIFFLILIYYLFSDFYFICFHFLFSSFVPLSVDLFFCLFVLQTLWISPVLLQHRPGHLSRYETEDQTGPVWVSQPWVGWRFWGRSVFLPFTTAHKLNK